MREWERDRKFNLGWKVSDCKFSCFINFACNINSLAKLFYSRVYNFMKVVLFTVTDCKINRIIIIYLRTSLKWKFEANSLEICELFLLVYCCYSWQSVGVFVFIIEDSLFQAASSDEQLNWEFLEQILRLDRLCNDLLNDFLQMFDTWNRFPYRISDKLLFLIDITCLRRRAFLKPSHWKLNKLWRKLLQALISCVMQPSRVNVSLWNFYS